MKCPSPALLFSSLLASALALSSSGLLCAQPFEPGVITAGHRSIIDGIGIPFIANDGQTDAAVAYYAQTFAGTVFITRDGRIVYSLPAKSAGREGRPHGRPRAAPASAGWSLTEAPVGATGGARPAAQKRAQTQVSYFLGNDPSAWRSGIATHEGVSLGQVWPGVTVSLRAHGKDVEKLFTVEPGADPSRIRMRVSGARSLVTDRSGALIASTGPGDVRLTPPAAYQEQGGARRAVAVAYEVHGDSYGFHLGGYDPRLPLVIDPLLQSTYLGGSGGEQASALAIHPTSGDVYVAGHTPSTNFPGTAGGAQTANGGSFDAFVARLPANLTSLTQATYLGGSSIDVGNALAIDPTSGDVYVAGLTTSTNFPGTTGGAQAVIGGLGDAFVARLPASLTSLTQATYLGSSGGESASALAIHPTSGDVYVAGSTNSTDFPGTAGGAQTANAGGSFDAFVARLTANLKSLTQATYLGGGGDDEAFALVIHPTTGDAYVAGQTFSTNFPGTAGGAQAANGGGEDVFTARLTASLTSLTQATYLGGSGTDRAFALAIHPTSGDVYVAGLTSSTNLPGTAGGAQAANGGGEDAFAARLPASLKSLTQATYLGGSANDGAFAVVIHPTTGDAYVAGETFSTNLPGTAGGAQTANGGSTDAFVARFSADLAAAAPPTPTPTPTATPTSTPTATPTATPTPVPGAGQAAIPTLDSRGLIALALILAAIGAFAIRRMSA